MSWGNNYSDDEDDEWDNTTSTTGGGFYKTSYFLAVIDTSACMFTTKTPNSLSPFQQVIRVCLQLSEELLLTLKDTARLCLILGSNENFTTFETPVPELVKTLLKMDAMTNEQLQKEFGSNQPMDVANLLLAAKRLYKMVKTAQARCDRNLVFITNDDNPVGNDKQKRSGAELEVGNLASGIKFDVVTLSEGFEYEEFYKGLLVAAKRPVVYEYIPCEEQDLLRHKLGRYCIYDKLQSSVSFYPFSDLSVSLRLCESRCVRRNRAVLPNIHLTLDHSQVVERRVQRPPTDVEGQYRMTGLNRDLTDLERNQLSITNVPVGYHLVTVASPVAWEPPPTTMSVLAVEGKLEPFWDWCRESGNVLICAVLKQTNGNLRNAELHPVFVNKQKMFKVHPLTYKSERHVDNIILFNKETKAANEEQVEATKELIESLTIPYNRDLLQSRNTVYLREWQRSKLLGVPLRPITNDFTSKKYYSDQSRVDRAVRKFKDVYEMELTKAKAAKPPPEKRARKK